MQNVFFLICYDSYNKSANIFDWFSLGTRQLSFFLNGNVCPKVRLRRKIIVQKYNLISIQILNKQYNIYIWSP